MTYATALCQTHASGGRRPYGSRVHPGTSLEPSFARVKLDKQVLHGRDAWGAGPTQGKWLLLLGLCVSSQLGKNLFCWTNFGRSFGPKIPLLGLRSLGQAWLGIGGCFLGRFGPKEKAQ